MTNKKSICLFCSLGCETKFRGRQIDYDSPLCPRGHYNFELLFNPGRFFPASFKDPRSLNPEQTGILLSGVLSNEEAYAAAVLANHIGTKNIASVSDPADLEAYSGFSADIAGASIMKTEEINSCDTLLVIGDILTRSPVLSHRINAVKYGKRGNKIIVVDSADTRTNWFATTRLKVKPGMEAALLSAFLDEGKIEKVSERCGLQPDLVRRAIADFKASSAAGIIYAPSKRQKRVDLAAFFVKSLSAANPGKKYLIFFSGGNTLGINMIFDRMVPGRKISFDAESVRNIFLFGDYVPFTHYDFALRAGFFPPADIPLASHMQSDGTYVLSDLKMEERGAIMAKAGSYSVSDIIGEWVRVAGSKEKIAELIEGWAPAKKFDAFEADGITPFEKEEKEEITNFGNNHLVSNFFWYRANNAEKKNIS